MQRLFPAAFLTLLTLGLILLAASFLPGCVPASNPTAAADQATVTADTAKLTADKAALATQPTTQAAAAVTADQSALAAAVAQEASDIAAIKTAQVQQGTQIAAAIAAAAPSPWGPLASTLIGVAGMGLVSYFGNKTNATQSANHTAAIATMAQQLAQSVPVSALPAKAQPIAADVIAGVNAVAGQIAANSGTKT